MLVKDIFNTPLVGNDMAPSRLRPRFMPSKEVRHPERVFLCEGSPGCGTNFVVVFVTQTGDPSLRSG